MSYRNDRYIGCEHFWLRWNNGTYEVRMETPECYEDNETVFFGSYEECLSWMDKAETEYNDSLF